MKASKSRRAMCICGALITLFAIISWTAVSRKSPTMDEPLHTAGAYLHVFERDDRINPEDPPLWKFWIMIPHRSGDLRVEPSNTDFAQALTNTDFEARASVRMLFLAAGVEGDRFIMWSRFMMLIVGVALGALIAFWGWKLGGAATALIGTTLYCFDPNFIAHAPLVKNDVAISLCLLATAMATWGVGRRVWAWNVILLCMLCGIAMTVKFSGVLVFPMLVLMLGARALFLEAPWPAFGHELRSRIARLAIAAGIVVCAGIVSVLIIWANYGFRFDPTPAPGVSLPMHTQVRGAMDNKFFLSHGQRYPTDEELAAMAQPLVVRAVLFAERHRLLPQAYLYGFLFTYQSSLVRTTFLLGEHSVVGWWYYFPLAMLFKTPLATLATILIVPLMLLVTRKREPSGSTAGFDQTWSILCLSTPLAIYGLSALTTNLNLGLRHVLPLYPFIYLLIGLAARHFGRRLKPVAVTLGVALALETLIAFPNYISFFNAIARPYRLGLLSDSNIDWGQDLLELARWREQNPATRLYLGYFGSAPPWAYGIEDARKIPGGYFLEPIWEWPEEPGMIAISALVLQGTGLPPSLQRYYAPLRATKPREILGGSIYLYDVPQPPLPRP